MIIVEARPTTLTDVPVLGGEGDDTISVVGEFGNSDSILVLGEGGQDSLRGGSANDTLKGGDADDTLSGDRGDDLLMGGEGDDLIFGQQGRDTVIGGLGGDTLGGNRDTYRYDSIVESTFDNPDLITDLFDEDVIDLSAIDADTLTSGNQAFTRVEDFTGQAGQLRLKLDGEGDTLIEGDIDGDAVADFLIRASGDQLNFTGFEY